MTFAPPHQDPDDDRPFQYHTNRRFDVLFWIGVAIILALVLAALYVGSLQAAPLFPQEPDGPPMTSDRGTCETASGSFDYYIDAYGLTPARSWTFVGRYVVPHDEVMTDWIKGYARLAFRPDDENTGSFGAVFVRDFHFGADGSVYTTTEEWPGSLLDKGYCALLDPQGWGGENRDESRGKYGPDQ